MIVFKLNLYSLSLTFSSAIISSCCICICSSSYSISILSSCPPPPVDGFIGEFDCFSCLIFFGGNLTFKIGELAGETPPFVNLFILFDEPFNLFLPPLPLVVVVDVINGNEHDDVFKSRSLIKSICCCFVKYCDCKYCCCCCRCCCCCGVDAAAAAVNN
jgi:hypothetical protein